MFWKNDVCILLLAVRMLSSAPTSERVSRGQGSKKDDHKRCKGWFYHVLLKRFQNKKQTSTS